MWWGKLLQAFSGVTLGHSFGVGHKVCDWVILLRLCKVIVTSRLTIDRANGVVIHADCQMQGFAQRGWAWWLVKHYYGNRATWC